MPREIEVKYRINDPQAVLTRLRECGARSVSFAMETNRIFDTPDRDLLTGDRGLRVRESQSLDGAPAKATLTYKGPRDAGTAKSREEIETVTADAAAMAAILARLGFAEIIVYEKRRETWRLGPCEIVLDELPRLGWWLEIEGPNLAAIQALQEQLALPDAARVGETYVEIAARYGDEDEHGRRALRFEE